MSFSAKRTLGQNFLNDQKIINLIVESGNINSKDIMWKSNNLRVLY